MHATEILKKAAATMEQRGKDNAYDKGNEERSAAGIAEIFNAISGNKADAKAIWLAMISLKLGRLRSQVQSGANVEDTIVDLVAYCALLGEELTK